MEKNQGAWTSLNLSLGCLKKDMLLFAQDPSTVPEDSLYVGV